MICFKNLPPSNLKKDGAADYQLRRLFYVSLTRFAATTTTA
jgi:hypothetical protein